MPSLARSALPTQATRSTPPLTHPAQPSGAEYDTIVIGGGQAGLAAGYHLRQEGLRFIILDAHDQIGASWKRRWDSLRLFTPARYNGLPGLDFPGERHSLPGKSDVAAYLRRYAAMFDLPVRLRSAVSALQHERGRFVVRLANGAPLTARSVIVATGANQRAYVPAFASGIASAIAQLHSDAYQRPAQLPDGKVLVVGAGNSGVQIALELAQAGRDVLLSGRHPGAMPRRLLGRDIYDWLWPTLMRPSMDSALGRRVMRGRLFAGDPIIGMPSGALERPGLSRVDKTVAANNGHPVLRDGTDVRDLAAIVWCTGFRPDFAWIELPVLGLDGYPVHTRGIADALPGLAFVGMRFQYRMNSALLGGVGEDAEYVVGQIAKVMR